MLLDSPTSRFTKFLAFVLKEECDWPRMKTGQYTNTPGDDGGPTKFGIDLRGQQTYAKLFRESPDVWTMARIKALTVDDATAIYWKFYWNGPPAKPHGCEALPARLGECAMNSWVNGGHPTQWVAECGGNAARYIEMMEAWYREIGVGHNRQFLPDWLGRSERLKAWLDL